MKNLCIVENHDYMDLYPFHTWEILEEQEESQYLECFKGWSGTVRIVDRTPISNIEPLVQRWKLTDDVLNDIKEAIRAL